MPDATNKPTLLFVSGKDPETELGGGHSSFVRVHIQAALKAGYKPHVICTANRTETLETDYAFMHRVKSPYGPLYLKCYPDGVRTRGYLTHRRSLVKATCEWLENHPEPVIIHGFGIWSETATAAISKINRTSNIRVISSQYTLLNQEYLSKLQGALKFSFLMKLHFLYEYLLSVSLFTSCERNLYQSKAEVLTNYRCVQDMIEAKHGTLHNAVLAPYCTELAFKEPLQSDKPILPSPLKEGPPLLISVSRHDPRKGVDVFIQALAILKSKGFAFNAVLIGKGDLLYQNRKLAASLNLESCTSVMGFVDDILPWLMHCEAYVLPSLEEQSGSMSLLEAMQCGACCISTSVDGMLEDITDKENGRHFSRGDAEGLADILAELIQDSDQRKKLGEAARKTFETKFHPAHLVTTLKELYSRS